MDYKLYIVIGILIISTIYLFFQVENLKKEGFSQPQMGADFESIRNLSNIAKELQRGGLTIPGNLKVSGQLEVNNEVKLHSDLNLEGNIKRAMM